jgi:hypothetical protein
MLWNHTLFILLLPVHYGMCCTVKRFIWRLLIMWKLFLKKVLVINRRKCDSVWHDFISKVWPCGWDEQRILVVCVYCDVWSSVTCRLVSAVMYGAASHVGLSLLWCMEQHHKSACLWRGSKYCCADTANLQCLGYSVHHKLIHFSVNELKSSFLSGCQWWMRFLFKMHLLKWK